MKKTLILGIITILLIQIATASNENIMMQDEDSIDTTINGTTPYPSAETLLNVGYGWAVNNDNIKVNNSLFQIGTNSISGVGPNPQFGVVFNDTSLAEGMWCQWIYYTTDSPNPTGPEITQGSTIGSGARTHCGRAGSATHWSCADSAGGCAGGNGNTTLPSTNGWVDLCIKWDSTDYWLMINGTDVFNNPCASSHGSVKIYNNGKTGQTFDDFRLCSGTDYTKCQTTISGGTTFLKLNAQSSINQVTINEFNATNTTETWNTSSGTLTTNITSNGQLTNLIITANGFTSVVLNNINTSNTPYMVNMTPLTPQANLTITNTTLQVGNNITMNCAYNNPTPHTENIIYKIYNEIGNTVTTQTLTRYTLQNTDLFDALTFRCEVNTSYGTWNSTINGTIANNTINAIITWRAIDTAGTLLQSVSLVFTEILKTITSNPINDTISDYINLSTPSKNFTINGKDILAQYKNTTFIVNISENQLQYNLTFQPKQLTLTFNFEGTLNTTTGFIADSGTRVQNFTNSSYITNQADLAEGLVQIGFNQKQGTNHTQYYEYLNTQDTIISENIELLANGEWSGWIYVQDESNRPIEEATIRLWFANWLWNTTWSPYKLYSQRITPNDGYTNLFGDTNTIIYMEVSKTGYQTETFIVNTIDASYTKTDPKKIILKQDISNIADNIWVYLPRTIYNKSQIINGTLFAPTQMGVFFGEANKQKIEYTTKYRNDNSLTRYDLTGKQDDQERYSLTLTPDQDFLSTNNDNIQVYIYRENVQLTNITILYDGTPKQSIFTNWTDGIPKTVLNPILFLGIIILSLLIGTIIPTEGTSITVFKALTIIASIISIDFLFTSVLVLTGEAIRMVSKTIGE